MSPVPREKDWEKAINSDTREMLDDLMRKYGWEKEIIIERISYNPRSGPILTKYRCRGDRISCSCAGKFSLIYLQERPTGVVCTCGFCRTTQGPISLEIFDKLESRRLTVEEAYQIMERTNQMIPSGFPDRRSKDARPKFMV